MNWRTWKKFSKLFIIPYFILLLNNTQILIKLLERKENIWAKKIIELLKKKADIENVILENSDIILSSMNNRFDDKSRNSNFSYLQMDDVEQALEPYSL